MMEFENTIETQVTEAIMRIFGGFGEEDMRLETKKYNKAFGHVHKTLTDLGLSKRFAEDWNAVEDYKGLMRKRFGDKAESVVSRFPNGMFTKDKNGGLVGIQVATKKLVKECCELVRLENES